MFLRIGCRRRTLSGLAFLGMSPLFFAEVPHVSRHLGFQPAALIDEALASDPVTESKSVSVTSSLEAFQFPSEAALRSEAGAADRSVFNQSAELMVQWIRGMQRANLDTVCSEVMDPEDDEFEMTEFNLRCAPWWLEQRYLSERKGDSGTSAPSVKSFVPVRNQKDWQAVAGLSYHEFLRGFRYRDRENVLRHADYASDSSVSCEASAAMAALLGRMEEHLPDRAVWQKMKSVYQRYASCERPSDHLREMVHLRTGLMALFFQELDFARFALEKALVAPEKKEVQRTLFWLGMMDHQANDTQLISHFKNRYWAQLWAESPLSIHSIIAAHANGSDPYSSLVGDVVQPIESRDGTGRWTEFNLMAFVSELLIAREEALGLRAWSHKVASRFNDESPSRLLYVGLLHNKAHNYLQSIQSLSAYMSRTQGARYRPEFMKMLFPTPYSESILANSNNLDPLLVFGLIRQESAFNPNARSRANARGLMQLLPRTARTLKRVAPTELYDPDKNVQVGSLYLLKLLEKNENQFEKVLAAYNAGQANLVKWTKRFPGAHELLFADLIPFRETRNYVALIQRNAYWYGRLWVDQEDKVRPEIIARLGQNKVRSRTVDLLLQSGWSNSESADFSSHLPRLLEMNHFADR